MHSLIVLNLMVGLFKTWTYGAILRMCAVSVLSTHKELLAPYPPLNHLFWAAVPLLAALIALSTLPGEDRLLTFDDRL